MDWLSNTVGDQKLVMDIFGLVIEYGVRGSKRQLFVTTDVCNSCLATKRQLFVTTDVALLECCLLFVVVPEDGSPMHSRRVRYPP